MRRAFVGELGEAFEIAERGLVVIVKLTGDVVINVDDTVSIEGISTIIKGIEMVNYGSRVPPSDPPGVGLFVEGQKETYKKMMGSKVFLEKVRNDQNN